MGMNPRLLRPILSGDTDALRYIAAVQAADQQSLEPAVRKAITDFVVGCKADGIWSAIKASCILMGARTLSGALTPLAGTAPTNVNFVSGDYDRKTGLVGNASNKYLNTNRAGNADPQDSFHASVFGNTLDSGNNSNVFPTWMGTFNDSGGTVRTVQLFYPGSLLGYFFNARTGSTASSWVTALDTLDDFVGVSRSASNAVVGRAKSTNNSFSPTSVVPNANNIFVFAANVNGSANLYSAARLAFYSIGENLTLSLLDSRVTTLYNAIGTAIP
jgi:hypothetical protein